MVPRSGRRNRFPVLIVVLVVAAVVAPAVRDRASFPLSTYPIYADSRPRSVTLNVAVGIGRDGSTRPLSLDAIADTDDPLIAQSTLDRAVSSGRAEELCLIIATRAGPEVESVEIARERHDLIDRVLDEDSLRSRDLLARCEVIR